MTSTIFNDITNAFLAAFEAGTINLGVYSIPLLSSLALLSWYWQFGRSLAYGGGQVGDALAGALLYSMTVGVVYYMIVNLVPMTTALYQTFLQWGMSVGGGGAAGALLTPSTVVDLGFQIAEPMQAWAAKQTGWSALWNTGHMLLCNVAVIAIVVAFPLVAVALMLVQIEYFLAVMLCAILLPAAVLSSTAFLAEFVIGWLVGNLLRVLTTAALIGIGQPLFATAAVSMTGEQNPSLYSAMIVGLVSLLYSWLVWAVPNRCANMCGRVAIGLSGSSVVAGAIGGARVAMAGAYAIKGVSNMIQGRGK